MKNEENRDENIMRPYTESDPFSQVGKIKNVFLIFSLIFPMYVSNFPLDGKNRPFGIALATKMIGREDENEKERC